MYLPFMPTTIAPSAVRAARIGAAEPAWSAPMREEIGGEPGGGACLGRAPPPDPGGGGCARHGRTSSRAGPESWESATVLACGVGMHDLPLTSIVVKTGLRTTQPA